MQILKLKQFIREYGLAILLFPFIVILANYLIELIFQIGKLYGTFFRGIFQIVVKNV